MRQRLQEGSFVITSRTSVTDCVCWMRCILSDRSLLNINFDFIITKQTRCINFSILFLEWNSTCFGQFLCPSSGVFQDQDRTWFHPDPARKLSANLYGIHHCCVYSEKLLTMDIMILIASCQETCMIYTIAVCTVKNSWWWTEELSETCRVSFKE